MNKKLKTTIERSRFLILQAKQAVARLSPKGMSDLDGQLHQNLDTHVRVLTALLNPPVRFAWSRCASPGEYMVDVAGVNYHIIKCDAFGEVKLPWCATISRAGKSYHKTLAAAKQACVDYGVVLYKAKQA